MVKIGQQVESELNVVTIGQTRPIALMHVSGGESVNAPPEFGHNVFRAIFLNSFAC